MSQAYSELLSHTHYGGTPDAARSPQEFTDRGDSTNARGEANSNSIRRDFPEDYRSHAHNAMVPAPLHPRAHAANPTNDVRQRPRRGEYEVAARNHGNPVAEDSHLAGNQAGCRVAMQASFRRTVDQSDYVPRIAGGSRRRDLAPGSPYAADSRRNGSSSSASSFASSPSSSSFRSASVAAGVAVTYPTTNRFSPQSTTSRLSTSGESSVSDVYVGFRAVEYMKEVRVIRCGKDK